MDVAATFCRPDGGARRRRKVTYVDAPTSGARLRDVTEDDPPIFFDHQRDPIANAASATAHVASRSTNGRSRRAMAST
jgi:hypothetical protein